MSNEPECPRAGRPSIVDDQPPIVRAALKLADFSLELRLAGRRCEDAEEVLQETPTGQTRSATMALLAQKHFNEMLEKFDAVAGEYIAAKGDSISEARCGRTVERIEK